MTLSLPHRFTANGSTVNVTQPSSETFFSRNSKETDANSLYTDGTIWILCEVTSGVLTLVSVYITVALLLHMRKQSAKRLARRQRDSALFPSRFEKSNHLPKLREKPILTTQRSVEDWDAQQPGMRIPYHEQMSVESTKSNSNLISSSTLNRQGFGQNVIAVQKFKEKDKGIWLIRTITIGVFVVVIRCAVEQCLILSGNLSDFVCDILTKAMIALTALSLHCCHVFLWLRQLTFYSNPFLKPLRSRRLKVLSYAAYAVMPVTLAVALALYIWWRDYKSDGVVCKASERQNLNTYVPFGVLVACTVTIQILLSALFLYPLIVHKMRRKSMESTRKYKRSDSMPQSPCNPAPPAQKSQSSDKLMACIKRVLYGATVGITTDVVGGLVGIFLPDDIPMFAYSVLYNLNVFLNLLCLIYTFANWRQMLFPWCCPTLTERQFRDSKRLRRSSVKGENRPRQFKTKSYDASLERNGVSGWGYSKRASDN